MTFTNFCTFITLIYHRKQYFDQCVLWESTNHWYFIYRGPFYAKKMVCNHFSKFCSFVFTGQVVFVGNISIVDDGWSMFGSLINLVSVHSAE